jgi:hypothetical protein
MGMVAECGIREVDLDGDSRVIQASPALCPRGSVGLECLYVSLRRLIRLRVGVLGFGADCAFMLTTSLVGVMVGSGGVFELYRPR